jgi:Na+/H+-translocating membrane pyrophosphatase
VKWITMYTQSDILLCTLLTIITFGLVTASMFGLYYLTASHNIHAEVSRYWTETSIGVFLGIVVSKITWPYTSQWIRRERMRKESMENKYVGA